jgi:AraC family transcriptional regulator
MAMQNQRANYADRIEKIVQHLSRAIPSGEIPQLAELARIANLSDYHFHRIFRLMTGETPIAMVRRLRLAAAAHSMTAESTVTEAAAAAGYSTSQSFARAFRSGVGDSASAARSGGYLDSIKEQLSRPPKSVDAAPRSPITIEIVSLDPFTVTALRNVGDYAELNLGYARLVSLLRDPRAITGLFGIPYDDPEATPAAECRFDCCATLADAPAGTNELRSLRIAGGRFACLRQVGSYDQCWASLDRIYAHIIFELNEDFADAPPFIHYFDDPDDKPAAELLADLHVPLRGEP